MGFLKRLEAVYGLLDFVGVMRSKGDQLRHRAIVLRDDEAFPGFDSLEQLGQVRFRFKCANFSHLAVSIFN